MMKEFWGKGFEKESIRNQGVFAPSVPQADLGFASLILSVWKLYVISITEVLLWVGIHPLGLNSIEVRCKGSGIQLLP